MTPNVGVTFKCESNCFQWCPRRLQSSCCVVESVDEEDSLEERSNQVAVAVLKTREPKARCCTVQ